MEDSVARKYSIRLSFEEIRLPPFEDVLVLGKKNAQGKLGVFKSFELLVPNEFEVFEVTHDTVEAVFINRRILKKMSSERIIAILSDKVFPFVSESEMLKIDFKLKVSYDTIEAEF